MRTSWSTTARGTKYSPLIRTTAAFSRFTQSFERNHQGKFKEQGETKARLAQEERDRASAAAAQAALDDARSRETVAQLAQEMAGLMDERNGASTAAEQARGEARRHEEARQEAYARMLKAEHEVAEKILAYNEVCAKWVQLTGKQCL